MDSARELFAERGYAATGRELVADRAGVTRGALYHHFPNKEALFRAVVEAVEEETCDRLALVAMAGSDALDQLRLGCRAFLDLALEPEVRQIVLIDAPAVLGWGAWREMDERYGLALLREGVSHLLGEPASAVDNLAHMLLGALNEAAFLIATGDRPRQARAEVGATVDELLSLIAGGAKRGREQPARVKAKPAKRAKAASGPTKGKHTRPATRAG